MTEACLWETQRAGWSIKAVKCQSVFWDQRAKKQTLYEVGEFEKLFADKTKISLFYKGGIDAIEIVSLPALIQHLESVHPGCTLRLVSIRQDSGGAVVDLAIETAGSSGEDLRTLQAALEAEAAQKIGYQRQALAERDTRLRLEGEIKQLNSIVHKLIMRPSVTLKTRGISGDIYNVSGPTGAVGPHSSAHDVIVSVELDSSIDFSELSKQLLDLKQAISLQRRESADASQALSNISEAQLAAAKGDHQRVLEHLKAAGRWSLDLAKELGKDVAAAAIKQALGIP